MRSGAEKYNDDLDKLFYETRKVLNQSDKFGVELEVGEGKLGSSIYDAIKDIPGLHINYLNSGIEAEMIPEIEQKHSKYLNSRGPIAKGGHYWEVYKVLEHGVTLTVHLLWPWLLKHAASDFDEKVWNDLKLSVKKIISTVLKKQKGLTHDDLVMRMRYTSEIQHEIAFIFDKNLNDDDIENAFVTLSECANHLPEPEQPGPTLVVMKYDPMQGKWVRTK